MEQTVTISVTLPISKAELLLIFVQDLRRHDAASRDAAVVPQHDEPFQAVEPAPHNVPSFTPTITPHALSYLLDNQLRKLVSFAVEHNGTFYNKDLAEILGVDTPLTSIYLGHLTRKLSKTGVDAANWYTKHRTANGTLLTVREDVLEKFREAIKQ